MGGGRRERRWGRPPRPSGLVSSRLGSHVCSVHRKISSISFALIELFLDLYEEKVGDKGALIDKIAPNREDGQRVFVSFKVNDCFDSFCLVETLQLERTMRL